MSMSNEDNCETIVISSDHSNASSDEVCDDRSSPVVLAIIPSEKRAFTPTKKWSCPSDSDSEVDESLRYAPASGNTLLKVLLPVTIIVTIRFFQQQWVTIPAVMIVKTKNWSSYLIATLSVLF